MTVGFRIVSDRSSSAGGFGLVDGSPTAPVAGVVVTGAAAVFGVAAVTPTLFAFAENKVPVPSSFRVQVPELDAPAVL